MKIVIVNDCAFVGETLLAFLPPDVEKQHIRRSRGIWDKTFGIAYNILLSKGDVYHVNYLLQDCYIAARLGKRPLLGHAHGSDLRSGMNHFLWGRIVRHNLKNCDKILVSTPDVLNRARRFREDAEYLPNPVNTKLFYPKPFLDHGGKKRVLVASGANWAVKGTDIAIKALADIRDDVEVSIIAYGADLEKTVALSKELGLNLNLLPKVSHENLNEYYWNADVVLDQFRSGALGLISLEAIACGRPAIAYASSEYPEYNEFILRDLESEEEVVQAIDNVSPQLWKQQYSFFAKHHDPAVIVPKVLSIYNELLS